MNNKEFILKCLTDLIEKVFKGKMNAGYAWLRAHFPKCYHKDEKIESVSMKNLQEMGMCLLSKQEQHDCPTHGRIHSKT